MHGFVRLYVLLLAVVRDLLVLLPSFHHRTVVNAKYNHFIHLQESRWGATRHIRKHGWGGREREGEREGERGRERARESERERERAREDKRKKKENQIYPE